MQPATFLDVPLPINTLLIVDDDELSREVLALLATEAGYEVTLAESGVDALETLGDAPPAIILSDMQMPGLTGDSLARLLRAHCGAGMVLLAMSGSQPAPDQLAGFDGFLLKPFTMDDLRAAIAGVQARERVPEAASILNETIYRNLAQSMPAAQLRALYDLCLDDADRRMKLMETAAEARDADAFVRAAHAVKGGCGMVGASELAELASGMETGGLPPVGSTAPFDEFLAASRRLRVMLDAQST